MKQLAIIIFCVTCGPVLAASSIEDCATITDAGDRLRCYDSVARKPATGVGQPTSLPSQETVVPHATSVLEKQGANSNAEVNAAKTTREVGESMPAAVPPERTVPESAAREPVPVVTGSPDPVRMPEPVAADEAVPAAASTTKQVPVPTRDVPAPAPSTPKVPEAQEEEFGITLFGTRRGDPDLGESIQSSISDVYQGVAGNHVMTLANGQVWMEREPGRIRVKSGQDVVIVKRRWHYSMTLAGQNRRITVQRID